MKKFHLLKEKKVVPINKNISIRDNGATTLRVNYDSPTYISEFKKPQEESNFRILTEDWMNRVKEMMRRL